MAVSARIEREQICIILKVADRSSAPSALLWQSYLRFEKTVIFVFKLSSFSTASTRATPLGSQSQLGSQSLLGSQPLLDSG